MNKSQQRKPSKPVHPKLNTIHTTFKQAFIIKKNPFPWIKALNAGLAAALPIVIGFSLGYLEYGLLASIGAFTYLYVFNQPYAQRAKRIFCVALGMSLSMVLGSLLAPYPLGTSIVMGLIGAVAIFIFGALKITGPSALFFVLSFAMATGMPSDPSLALLRGGFVFLGGGLSWIICMAGWFISPHGPEITAIKKVYVELAYFLDSIGKANFDIARHQTVLVMKQAENMLLAGYSSKRKTDTFTRLFLLNEQANRIFLETLDLSMEKNLTIPSELAQSLRNLAQAIGTKKRKTANILRLHGVGKELENLFMKIHNASRILNDPIEKIQQEVRISKPSLKTTFLNAFDKNSIVFLSAIKFGIILMLASIIAYSFGFDRSYWVPLSCAAVMSGPTVIATFHRAVQRTFGTIIGVLLASVILVSVHNGYMVAFIILCLTFLTELFIVRNYGIAAMFFTPSALVMAEYSAKVYKFSFFATVRITDIIVGVIIGLIGIFLVGRKSASSVLNHFTVATIRSQGQFLLSLFSKNNQSIHFEECKERDRMQTNLVNLLTVYDTALGELFSNKAKLESLWPVIFSVNQIGYYLESSFKYYERPTLPDKDLAQLLYVFETMALTLENNQYPIEKHVPEIEGFSNIQNQILNLQKALRFEESF
ncbi:FUSC family protein [Priestia filamentosa]|uniref:FUSC family protein n=1 Tax=Priestia filamentosa TaxID=1402861 RepID=UPI000A084F9A|nr:FUSC family protein [Priestia filamentosa]MDT3762159.1 FUSC family protein [Priestia filamentosa]OXS65861.1 hypothetical protein B1B01_20635 [Priestia filamentosa]SMF62311.1 Uncharacterized membrane protein YccC [Priestia filamentosa]